jgi:uncharacterized protein YecE (DUF72 family)
MPDSPYYFGPAGWSYPDWRGIVYPERLRGHALNYLEQYFNLVEINNTFYHTPDVRNAEKWCLLLKSKEFQFVVKLGHKFTHQREDIGIADRTSFLDLFRVMKYYGRLGGVLIQFPWSFINTGSHFDYLKKLHEWFGAYPLVVEVRHDSWHKLAFFNFLNQNGVSFCNIDQPRQSRGLPLTDYVTGPLGYLRLHGRNEAHWFGANTNRDMRYDYLYQASELDELTRVIHTLKEKAGKVFVVGNNHYRGQAVINLIQLKEKVTGMKIPYPEPLAKCYRL